jgi:hypothetical protein
MTRVNAVLDRVRRLTTLTEQTLKRELRNIEDEAQRLTAQFGAAAARIRATLRSLGDHGAARRGRPPGSVAAAGTKKRKRIRRSPEQLQKVGESVVRFIRSKGDQGASGVEIRKLHDKIGPDIKGFVEKFGDQKLKTTGVKSSMRYFVR